MHYLDKLHRPSFGKMRWVGIQSAKHGKLGQNSTGVDITVELGAFDVDGSHFGVGDDDAPHRPRPPSRADAGGAVATLTYLRRDRYL
jgi:hypothetical protein